MPTRSQAKQAFEAMSKDFNIYSKMNEEGKRAAWSYARDNGLIQRDRLKPQAQAEFDKYVGEWSQYEPKITPSNMADVLKYDSHAAYQGPKVPLSNPKSVAAAPVISAKQISGTRLEDMGGSVATPKPLNMGTKTQIPIGKAGLVKRNLTPVNTKMIPIGKAGIIKAPAREFNNADAFLLGAAQNTGKLGLSTLNTINSVVQAPATMGKYGTQEANKAAQEGKNQVGGLLKGYGIGLGKAVKGEEAVANTEVVEGIAPKTTAAVKEKYPGAYKLASEIVNMVDITDLTALGILGDLAKVQKLGKLPDTTKALIKANAQNLAEISIKTKAGEALTGDEQKLIDTIKQDIMYVDPYGNVRKTPTTDLQLEAPQKANLPKAKNIKTALQDVEVPANIQSKGKAYGIKNTALEKAQNEYDNAIREIQNYYGDTYVTSEELKKAGKGLGIDFDQLLKNIDDAQTPSISRIGEMERLKATSGLKALPNLTTTKTIPQQVKLNRGIQSALERPNIAPSKNIEAPFRLTPAEQTRIKPIDAPKPLNNINTLPIENKSTTIQINKANNVVSKESEIIAKQKNINKLKKQLDMASNPEEIKALKNTLAAERKVVKEYNKAARQTKIDKVKGLLTNSDKWKDKKGLTGTMRLQRETWDRNIIDIAGEDGKAVKEAIFTPIHTNEAARTRFKNSSRATIKSLNLSPQEREIVQRVGEGQMALTDIPQGMNSDKIQKSVDTFRTWYNGAIDTANEVLVKNGYPPVQKLENYFPHFTGDDPLMKALGIKLDNMELPTDINGITANFKPGKQFFGNFLKRTGDKTTYDAVAGFDRYVEGISNVIYHTDDIKTLRAFVDELRLKYSSDEVIKRVEEIRNSDLPETEMEEAISNILKNGDTHLSNSVADLEEYTNVLAGKKDLADRAAERMFGRPIYNAVNVLSNRIGKNMVAINPGSWLTNFIPVTQSLATTSKGAVLQAFDDTMRNLVKNDGFVDKSTFLTNRVGSDILDKGIVEKTGDVLSAPFKWIDNFTSNVVTRAKYWEGIDKGMAPEDAMRQADDWAAKILGDRSKGAQPTLFNQRNPITRVLTQFQLEVNNQVSFIMKDIPREYLKDGANPQSVARLTSAVGQLAIYSWLYNEMYEKATGRRPAADIIGIALNLKEDLQNPNIKKSQAGINLAQNVANTLPFSSVFTGGRIPIGTPLAAFGKGITGAYEVATGERDAKTGLAQAGKDLAKGAAYIVPPFGGSQAIKTIEGLSAVNKGGIYKTNAEGEEALQYPIEKTTGNKVQAAIFGKSALGETRAFYDNKVKALGIDQTKAYEYAVAKGIEPKAVYNQLLALRKLIPDKDHKGVTDAQRTNSIWLNQNLTTEQKKLMVKLFVKTEEGKKLLEKIDN